MTLRPTLSRLLAFALAACPLAVRALPPAHTFVVSGGQFLLDGKPYQILSGEMHYPRVPRAYWRDRFRWARAMGLNTITTYAFWNVHEPRPGVYDFSGQNDLGEYLREAQEEGLHVILRPGPYVCAEWELGGYPSWLLRDRSLVLRSLDPKFLAAQDRWLARLAEVLRPELIQNGGPIIAVQIENEYGSFNQDPAFVATIRDAYLRHGIETAVMYTVDGPRFLGNDSLPGVPAAVNFGGGRARQSFARLEQFRPQGIRMCGEFWDGWFDHWGEMHSVTRASADAADYGWMVDQGFSVSLYMFEGGTSFGWMNGANIVRGQYEPDTTSYDYDAPLDESGRPRQKFFLLRDAITKHTGVTPPPPPAVQPRRAYPVGAPEETASLWDNLPAPVESSTLLSFEDLGQNYGYVLYRTALAESGPTELTVEGLHDYAAVYVDRVFQGTLDRRLDQKRLLLKTPGHTLDLLVENTGRVNFTVTLRGERQGILGAVTVGGVAPTHWKIYSLPMDDTAHLAWKRGPARGPSFFRADMQVDAAADTYLDTRSIHKGFVWLNDRPLGRAWSIGPQFALYAPGPWLRPGHNRIVFFDLEGGPRDKVQSVADPLLGPTQVVHE